MSDLEMLRQRRGDEKLLAEYVADPDPRRLAELVKRYQPLVFSLAGRYRGRHESFDDLTQVANLGLVKAIQGFEPERRTSFAAYAVPTILGEIKRHFRDRVWNLRLPRGLQETTLKLEGALDQLGERLGRAPSVEELADETGLSLREIDDTLVARDVRWTSSFEAPVGDGEGDTKGDLIGSIDPGFDQVEADDAGSRVTLDHREKATIEMRFVQGMTQAEIGERLGCSQMQVSRISRKGLAKLLAAVQGHPGQSLAA